MSAFKTTLALVPFFVVHSVRDMWRNRSRTLFALVCVATGVAAVVALRSLAFMIGDELTQNLAEINRGDVRLYASTGVPGVAQLSEQGDAIFTQEAVKVMRDWASDEQVEMTVARLPSGLGFAGGTTIRRIEAGETSGTDTTATLFVEPGTYPYYSQLVLDDPRGKGLEEVLTGVDKAGRYPIVISSNMTVDSRLGLKIGDVIRLGASDTEFVVRGIVSSSSETILTLPALFLFKYQFVYLPMETLPAIDSEELPNQVFLKIPLGRDIAAVEASLIAALRAHIDTDVDLDKELNRVSVPELEKQNSETADVIGDMILAMGLSSLLIGGIGIINTMLVVVSRRTLEVAVLKTLGLKGYRVTLLFLVEAAIMGLLGSLLGVVLGVWLGYAVKSVGEETLTLSLSWRLYWQAMLDGLLLGLITTILFGFLPTLVAGQVRPAIVLRPNEAQMPAAGLIQTLVTMLIMIIVLGLLVNTIIEGAISISPIYMISGAAILIGLFGGVIVANTRLRGPLPGYYQFRLARRYDKLDARLVGWVGAVVPGAGTRAERGRKALTITVRSLRQMLLLYGALAVGAALASGIILIVSELWVPFGMGKYEPAGNVIGMLRDQDYGWAGAWLAVFVGISGLIRKLARRFAGLIALSSLGASLGGVFGYATGKILETLLSGTGIWDFLSEISTGFVVVEGALALLAVVYVGYWLLVWLVGKMSPLLMMGVISLTVLIMLAGTAFAVARLGDAALIALLVALVSGWLALWWSTKRRTVQNMPTPAFRAASRSTPYVLLGAAVVTLVAVIHMGNVDQLAWLGFVVLGFVLWRRLRRYRVDGRLVLREMTGRRQRVASTLLGLSVGIAGLSVVSLTTSAVSNLLEIQLGENAEGNLLVMSQIPGQEKAVAEALNESSGVEYFSQIIAYESVLLEINGEKVLMPHQREMAEQENPMENSNFESAEQGTAIPIAERQNLDDLPRYRMVAGKQLGPDDAGTNKIMVRQSFFTEEFGIGYGDTLLFGFENGPGDEDDVTVLLRVTGVIARTSEQTGFGDQFIVPPGTLSGRPEDIRPRPFSTVTIAQIDESQRQYMDEVMARVADVPGVIPVELSALTQLIESLLEQLKAIPTLVAWLALVAGTAIIANTVALATQERRRQIGVMKAIGLKGRRVLSMLMIENGLIGLIAGLIGAVVGGGITVVIVLATRNPDELRETIEFSTVGWLLMMSIGVAVGAATLSAWNAAAEKPMNVLRYE